MGERILSITIPQSPLKLILVIYRKIFPFVHQELAYWKKRASQIKDPELKKQALASISHKTFHCEGGGIYAILAKENYPLAIKFIVAYQTISDYLDNLCDRSTSLDEKDFTLLHQAMADAITPDAPKKDYYAFRNSPDDNGYLHDLVLTCQRVIKQITNYHVYYPYILKLVKRYCELQVYKHLNWNIREMRLQEWFREHEDKHKDLTWFEFAACTGSTLGIFCLISYSLKETLSDKEIRHIFKCYFPYVQGLHIMLDYYIDQVEDTVEGDLNFCSYYESKKELEKRFLYFMIQAKQQVTHMRDERFHQLILKGLVGLYLADPKVKKLPNFKHTTRTLLKEGGIKARFFYANKKLYQLLQ
jgi:tetraprenyl-beta-curcumene synthase